MYQGIFIDFISNYSFFYYIIKGLQSLVIKTMVCIVPNENNKDMSHIIQEEEILDFTLDTIGTDECSFSVKLDQRKKRNTKLIHLRSFVRSCKINKNT